MAERVSAGLVMYRVRDNRLEVFLAHPGGPFTASKDDGYWTIPKGEGRRSESLLQAAEREFEEEVGIKPTGPYESLGSIIQKGGKTVHAWAFPGDTPAGWVHHSNTYTIEWPPRSGMQREFPEMDRSGFFPMQEARRKLKESQIELIERLEHWLQGSED